MEQKKSNAWLFVVIGVLITVIAVLVIQSMANSAGYKTENKRLAKENETLTEQLDSVQRSREDLRLELEASLAEKDLELEGIRSQISEQDQIIRTYENKIKRYNAGDFNQRFELFTELTKANDLPR